MDITQRDKALRYRLTIEYDGTPFCGWQRQSGQTTVQEVLEVALQTALRQPIELVGSGRTDTGVHALGQVAHFDTDVTVDTYRLRESLNALVRPHPISVLGIEVVPDTFHARFSAKQRAYLYRIQNTRFPPALNRDRVWWYVHPLNESAMQEAANLLIGKHDLSTFRASGCQAHSPVKTIDTITIRRTGVEVCITIKARSFLYHQVRNIVGSLVYVGCGKWSVADFESAFQSRDRKRGGETAPACGLYFISVDF